MIWPNMSASAKLSTCPLRHRIEKRDTHMVLSKFCRWKNRVAENSEHLSMVPSSHDGAKPRLTLGLLPRAPNLVGPRLFWFEPSKVLHPRQSSPVLGTLGWLVTLPLTPGLCFCLCPACGCWAQSASRCPGGDYDLEQGCGRTRTLNPQASQRLLFPANLPLVPWRTCPGRLCGQAVPRLS